MANDDELLQQQIINQLDRIAASVDFYADFLNNFKRDRSLHPDKHEKYLNQEDGRIATFHFNYITLLTKDNEDRFQEAIEANRTVLMDHPENFIALWCSVEMCSRGDEKDFQQARQHISLLENIRQKRNEMILAKTEVGALYTHFGAEFYRHSITLYEEALSEVSQLIEEEIKEPYFYETIMKVKIGLAKNLNKLMSGNMMEEYWPNSGLDYPTLYKKIAALLDGVMRTQPLMKNGEHCMDMADFKRQKSTALAELGYATSKYLNWRNRMNLPVEDIVPPDTFFEAAMEIAAETPYVLEKYGQYLRFQADKDRNMSTYARAIPLFQKALELEPSRYLTAHELGRTFKSMWLLNDTDNNNTWPKTSEQNPVKFVSKLTEPQLIPQPTRTPTLYEACHSFNPISKDPSNEHCSQSVKYFEKACELDNNSCSLYLVDLARMYMSTNRIEEAKLCLDRAEQLKFTNAKSAATLSLQLAMWYQQDINTNPEHLDSIRMAIRYHRSAIGYMVMCSFNPNFAFINLCHLLYKETQNPVNERDTILQREYFITLFLMENADPRRDLWKFLTHGRMLDEVLKLIQLIHERGTDSDCAAAFVYITILEKNNLSGFHDNFCGSDKQQVLLKILERATITCVFPENTLSVAYHWFLTLRMQPNDTLMRTRDMQMQPRDVRMQPHDMRMQPRGMRMQPHDMRMQFHDMRMQPRGMRMQPHDMRMQSHDIRMQPRDMRMQTHDNMICLLGQSRKDQKTAKVLQILALCNLPVFHVYKEDFKNSDDRSIKDVQLFATVIIKDENPDGNQASLKNVFQRIADVNKTIDTNPVCLASFGTPDHIEFLTNYSTWLIPEEIGETDVRQAVDCGFKLLRAIFFGDSKKF